MEAHQLAEESAAPVQLSLRIRHPAIDPKEISTALGIEPEHCFKARDAAKGRTGRHTQTYWLAPITAESWPVPIDPSFMSTIAERYPGHNLAVSEENLRKAAQNLRARSTETMLFYALQRLNTRHAFLERIQSDGGDVSLLLSVEPGSALDFTLPVAMMRLMVKWESPSSSNSTLSTPTSHAPRTRLPPPSAAAPTPVPPPPPATPPSCQ